MIKVWQRGGVMMGCVIPCLCFAQNQSAHSIDSPLPRYSTNLLTNLRGLPPGSEYPNLLRTEKSANQSVFVGKSSVSADSNTPSATTVAPINVGTAENLPHDATGEVSAPATRTVREAPNSCDVSRFSLCYDYRTGRPIYKPARNWMPEINGLRAENMTLSRSRLTFSYSFK